MRLSAVSRPYRTPGVPCLLNTADHIPPNHPYARLIRRRYRILRTNGLTAMQSRHTIVDVFCAAIYGAAQRNGAES